MILLDTHRSVGISHSAVNSIIPCRIDSKFRNDLYFDCSKSFEQLLNGKIKSSKELSSISVNITKIIQLLLLFIVIFAQDFTYIYY